MSKDTIPATPFPRQAEILLAIVNAFHIQKDRKKLNEYMRFGDASGYDIRDNIIDKIIYPTLANDICSELAKYVQYFLKQALDDYLRVVIDKDSNFSFVQRQDALPFLAQEIGSMTLLHFFSGDYLSEYERGLLLSLKDNETLFESVVKQLSNDTCWQDCYDGLKKEDKDKILSWKQGKSLPSLQSIKLLFNKPEQKKFKRLFLLTRVIEFIRQSEVGRIALDVAIYELKGEQYDRYPDPSSYAPVASLKKIKTKDEEDLFHKLFDPKEQKDKNSLRNSINKFSQNVFLQGLDVYGLFELYMFEAQWHVLAGENNKALKYYKQAFNHALYRVGNQQKSVIKRALCVAAEEKDMPFLKQLKNQAIVFGIYNPPFPQDSLDIKVNNKSSRTRSNIVEDWEIKWWQNEFNILFPKEMFFDGHEGIEEPIPIGMTTDKKNSIKPDYRHLNRNITIQVAGRMKKEPQLVWFIAQRNYEVVVKLLDKGASVDVYSDAGDTPLLMSVIQMSKDKLDCVGQPDDSFFVLLSKYKHKPETVNRRTSKKRLTPLISAIDTGRLDVVQKLLEMGAEVDRKASADDVTPLYYCITLLNRIQNPQETLEKVKQQAMNPEVKNEMRRFSPLNFGENLSNPLMDSIITQLASMIPNIDTQAVEDMACLLLRHKANPNCEHDIKGSDVISYTPLMLAAENNAVNLFEYMLSHGGDIKKKATFSNGQAKSLKEICKEFKSKECLDLLERNEQ